MSDLRRETRTLLSVLARTGRRRAIEAFGLVLVGSVIGGLFAVWLRLLVNGAVRGDVFEIFLGAAAIGVSQFVANAATTTGGLVLSDIHEACGREMTQERMRLSGGMPGIEHHERPEYVDRLEILSQHQRWLSGFSSTLAQSVALLGRIAITVVLLALVSPLLALLPLLALPAAWTGSRAEIISRRAEESVLETRRAGRHLYSLVTTAAPAREARIFGLTEELIGREQVTWSTVTRVITRAKLRAAALRTAGWLPFAFGYIAAVALVTVRATRGEATPGDVVLVASLAAQVNFQVTQAAQMVSESTGTLRMLRHYLWLQDVAEAASAHVDARRVGPPAPVPARLTHGIDVDNVTFRYPGTEREVLSSVSIHIAAGSTVAIVGENGAGKTSIVKLLCRYYEPASGRITVDGVDLASLPLDEWRLRCTAGFQDFVKFELVLREAVGVGDIARIDDSRAVAGALQRAGTRLPIGLDAQLGTQWEKGAELSEGEWQRVAIARATMRDAPVLLILDEPTSALDAHAEHALFERYATAARSVAQTTGAITLLVSHRFSTVRMADHIVVLADGKVVEQGDHRSLIAAGGLYAELYGIQAHAYGG